MKSYKGRKGVRDRRWAALSKKRGEKSQHRKRLRKQRSALELGQIPRHFEELPTLFAPEHFQISAPKPRTELLHFLAQLRELTLKRKKRVRIDFSRTKKMWSCGTLLFLAEVRRIVDALDHRRPILCKGIADDKVAQVLEQIGFLSLIGRKMIRKPTADDVVNWCALTGRGAEGAKANELVEHVGSRIPRSLSSPIYDGLVEAMTNCTQHAYLRLRRDGCRLKGAGEWWMFAQEKDGTVYVSICDLGIGIPDTLPLTKGEGLIEEVLARLGRMASLSHSDSDLIRAAVEIGRSRTKNRQRGKGLNDVVEVVQAAGTGSLTIFSNTGRYTLTVEGGKSRDEVKTYRRSILGTLIQWSIPSVPESIS